VKKFFDMLFGNSLFLIFGAFFALAWANAGHASYLGFKHFEVFPPGWLQAVGLPFQQAITLDFLVNDILMAFFFGIAGKEVFEAMLPGGSLRHFQKAATPIICALGGMAGPAGIYLAGTMLLGQMPTIGHGWAVPCATDVAFSYLIARLIFGKGHPATPFLLLLAIADDAFGLIVLAVFYPVAPLTPGWLLLSAAAVLIGLTMKRAKIGNFWWYILGPGVLSWVGFAAAGIHPALALLPIVVTLPHGRGQQHVHWEATGRKNPLDKFEAWWKKPVEVILGLFGLLNAGVVVTSVGSPTYLILIGLLAGKPLGIFLSALVMVKLLHFQLPDHLTWRELFVLGCMAGIGFTVALFVATVAFPAGGLQDAAKMGALASFLAVFTSAIAAKLLGVGRLKAKTLQM
jgi:NhaA family Na+:H+ antiporter